GRRWEWNFWIDVAVVKKAALCTTLSNAASCYLRRRPSAAAEAIRDGGQSQGHACSFYESFGERDTDRGASCETSRIRHGHPHRVDAAVPVPGVRPSSKVDDALGGGCTPTAWPGWPIAVILIS